MEPNSVDKERVMKSSFLPVLDKGFETRLIDARLNTAFFAENRTLRAFLEYFLLLWNHNIRLEDVIGYQTTKGAHIKVLSDETMITKV